MATRKTLDVVEQVVLVDDEGIPLTDEQRGVLAARDRLAASMGEEAEAIAVANSDVAAKLMQAGVVINLHIGCWTGKRKLQPEDLGLDDYGDAAHRIKRAINLGEVALIPPTLMRRRDSVIVQMRRNLDRFSYSTAWGQFVPAGVYQRWKERHEELVAEFFSIRDDLVEHLDELWTSRSGMWAELRLTYEEHARLVWCRLQRLPATEANLPYTPDWFIQQYVEAILRSIPSSSYIERSFYVQAIPTLIPLPSILVEDELRAQRLREQSAAERQMQADVQKYYTERKTEMVDEFLGELVREIRSRVYDTVTVAIASLEKNQGKLVGKTAQGLRNLIEWVDAMNIYDDQEIGQGLARLRHALDQAAGDRDMAAIKRQLKALGTVSRSTLLDLGLQPKIADRKLSVAARDELLGLGAGSHRALAAAARADLGTDNLPELGVVTARRLQARQTGDGVAL